MPLQREKLPNETNANITTQIDARKPTTIATSTIIAIPTKSTFGGPRSSSFAITRSQNISAKFRIAKYFTAIKSITCPTKILSYAFERAHASISVYHISSSFEYFGYSSQK